MSYKLVENGVLRLADNTFIPDDPLNADWQTYQAWLDAGNTPEPADPPPPPSKDEIAKVGAKQWFQNNPATLQIITLEIPELEAEVAALVNALYPNASTQNKNREIKIRMAQLVAIRVLVNKDFN